MTSRSFTIKSIPVKQIYNYPIGIKECQVKRILAILALVVLSSSTAAADMFNGEHNFYKSDNVIAQKVTFKNQYEMNARILHIDVPSAMQSKRQTVQ
jgi:hypothetical protein